MEGRDTPDRLRLLQGPPKGLGCGRGSMASFGARLPGRCVCYIIPEIPCKLPASREFGFSDGFARDCLLHRRVLLTVAPPSPPRRMSVLSMPGPRSRGVRSQQWLLRLRPQCPGIRGRRAEDAL